MELRHLRYFVAVAEEENVTKAALRLHLSQPSLSRQIRNLEAEIGFPLLKRTPIAVKLTDAGRTFLAEAKDILLRVESAVSAARSVSRGHLGEVHVGYSPMPTAKFLPQTIHEFQRRFPRIKFVLHDLDTKEMLAGLRNGTLHVAFMVKPLRGMLRDLKFEALSKDEFRVAMRPGHRLSRHKGISLKDLKGEKFVVYSREEYPDYHEYLRRVFKSETFNIDIVEEHTGGASLVTALEAGTGIALLPKNLELTAGDRIKLVGILPAPVPIIIGATCSTKHQHSSVEKLLDCARSVSR